MRIYRCKDCGAKFAEPDEYHTTWESYYGVYNQFPDHHPVTILSCPNCGSESIEDFEEDEEDEEEDE